MKIGEKSIGSNTYDILLICLPIWVPIILILSFYYFSEMAAVIFLLTLFFLGETHFAATWLFFFDSNNKSWLKERPYISLVFPILIVIALVLVFFLKSPGAAILLSSIASAFHVTRQSIGINKIFSEKDNPSLKLSQLAIYGASGFFLFIGFLRFFTEYKFTNEQLTTIQIFSVILCLAAISFIILKNKELQVKFHLTVLTGMILYAPYTFVPRPEYAVAIGVGMHYVQYLSLTMPIYLRKSKLIIENKTKNFISNLGKNKLILFSYLIVYAALMIILRQWGKGFNTFEYSALIIIPICLQSLHFYYDGFIWRFSDPHIRKEIAPYIFSKKEEKVSAQV